MLIYNFIIISSHEPSMNVYPFISFRYDAFAEALPSKWASKEFLESSMRVAVAERASEQRASSDLSKFCSSVTYLITDNRSIDPGRVVLERGRQWKRSVIMGARRKSLVNRGHRFLITTDCLEFPSHNDSLSLSVCEKIYRAQTIDKPKFRLVARSFFFRLERIEFNKKNVYNNYSK